jgi:hypothetical protein
MPLNYGREIFNQNWVNKLSKTPEATMVSTVSIYSPQDVTYTLVGNKYQTTISKYHRQNVKARIQPLRAPVQRFISTGGTDVQNVLISMPISEAFDIRPQDRITVITAPLRPELKNFIFIVKEVVGSGNDLEWTVGCEVDTEVVNGS